MKANKLTHGGNLRWESSRMMLPEHVAALKKHDIEKGKMERPILDEDELQKLSEIIQEAIQGHLLTELFYYRDGFIRQKIGYIEKIDPIDRLLTIRDLYGLRLRLPFVNIVTATHSMKCE